MNVPREVVQQALRVALQRERTQREVRHGLVVGALALLVLFLLPAFLPWPYRDLSVSLGAPGVLTVLFLLDPDRLRSRRGSLVPAKGLIAMLWCAGWVVAGLILAGQVRG